MSVVVLAKDGDQLLLIRQYRAAVDDYVIQLPGGGVGEEEDLESAARREMLEETGFICGRHRRGGLLRLEIQSRLDTPYGNSHVLLALGLAMESSSVSAEVVKRGATRIVV